MVFGRRNKPAWYQRVIAFLWPQSGFRRAGQYLVHRLRRMPGTPHGIAAGFASGAAVSFTPFLGFHILLTAALTFLLRGNYLSAGLGTLIGNPWTLPAIFVADYRLGSAILGRPAHHAEALSTLGSNELLAEIRRLIWPMTVGALPLALLAFAVSYIVLRRFVAAAQEARRLKRERRLRAIAAMQAVPASEEILRP